MFRRPDQCVSAIAEHFNLPLPVVSQYLRTLEARGILTVRRTGRRVVYRPAAEGAFGLFTALRQTFDRDAYPIEAVFTLATAFTHPRRIEIYRLLRTEPQSAGQLREGIRASSRAVFRQIKKLELRGFVTSGVGAYHATLPSSPLGRVLARLAMDAE